MVYLKNKKKIDLSKTLKYVVMMTIILNIFMPCFFNIVDAAIYLKDVTLPISEIKYNATDNSSVFPDSYKAYIKNLKASHTNWVFKAVYTGLDWTESVSQESYEVNPGISAVPDSYSSNWKKDGINKYIDGSFVIASKKAVAYTMDPRNYLNDTGIFQFEALDFNSETSTTSTIDKILLGTTMSSFPTQYKKSLNMVTLENGLAWTQIIINAAKNSGGSGISAVFLASRMKQETSLEILNNESINGSSLIYPGIYNFFNIGSTPNSDGTGSVTNGLAYASSQGWTIPQKSIAAGAIYLWSNYIKWGQNTIYFQKFDVNNPLKDINIPSEGGVASALYAYQYMTNILAPSSESKITYNACLKSNILNANFVFYIPVYNNMSNIISAHPDSEITESTITGTDIIYLDDGTINGTDYFNIRSGAGSEYDTIAQMVEISEGAENRTKFTRTQKGTNGWDKIQLSDGRQGYVYQAFVCDYSYTHLTGVSLDKSIVVLKAGDTTTLTANILPTNAYVKNVKWWCNNTNVATVDCNGKITAVGKDTTTNAATVFAITLDGNKEATCVVKIGNPVTGITLDKSDVTLGVGSTTILTASILPTNATVKNVTWLCNNTNVATVDSNGKITAIGKDTTTNAATIFAVTKDGNKEARCVVKVKTLVTGITLNKSIVTLKTGDTTTLIANVLPSSAYIKDVTWRCNNTNVATVDSNGKITAIGNDTTTNAATVFTVTKDGNKEARCVVIVSNPVTGITLDRSNVTLSVGSTTTLNATILPTNATIKTVTWWCNNTNVATVDSNGKITAIGKDTTTNAATIFAVTKDGNKEARCVVTVK